MAASAVELRRGRRRMLARRRVDIGDSVVAMRWKLKVMRV
jgi:hypothetical protein